MHDTTTEAPRPRKIGPLERLANETEQDTADQEFLRQWLKEHVTTID